MFLVEKSNIQQEPAEKNISQILLCFKCFFSKRHPTYSKNLQKKVSHKSYFVSNVLFLAQDIHIKQELMKIQANFTRSRFQSVYIQDPKCAIYLLPINFFSLRTCTQALSRTNRDTFKIRLSIKNFVFKIYTSKKEFSRFLSDLLEFHHPWPFGLHFVQPFEPL